MSILNNGVIEGNSLDELLFKGLLSVAKAKEVKSRLGETTKELLNTVFVLRNPRNRWMVSKARKHNIYHQIAESIWVLSGHDDLKYLSRFLPGCKNFSDDWNDETGEGHWRSGYGQRIRSWVGTYSNDQCDSDASIGGTDQWANVINELKKNPNTRQAVITIWDPMIDGDFGVQVLDRACNNHLQFLLRDGKLHMLVTQRSSDCIWGFTSINIPEFTIMQELTASLLGVEVGEYSHRMGSFHVYDRHFDKCSELITEYNSCEYLNAVENPVKFERLKDLKTLDNIFDCIYNSEMTLRERELNKSEFSNLSELFRHYPVIMSLFVLPLLYKRVKTDGVGSKTAKEIAKLVRLDALPPQLVEKVKGDIYG